jgi:hypothetical protein
MPDLLKLLHDQIVLEMEPLAHCCISEAICDDSCYESAIEANQP